jgi:hypothetical protein
MPGLVLLIAPGLSDYGLQRDPVAGLILAAIAILGSSHAAIVFARRNAAKERRDQAG